MGERTIPILPCRSIDENLGFYRALGFQVTFHQDRPNAYAVIARGGIELHFFAMKAYQPTASYSTCYITTTDVDGLYDAFRGGLRAALGRVPTRGLPRIGPLKNMSYGVRQSLVTDPGGNTLRIGQPIAERFGHADPPRERFARALHTAVLLAALVLRADLAVRMDDPAAAEGLLGQAREIQLTSQDRAMVGDELRRAEELAAALAR